MESFSFLVAHLHKHLQKNCCFCPMQVPYLAWSEGGLFALPISLLWLLPQNILEVFGPKAGVEWPRKQVRLQFKIATQRAMILKFE
jgi:hypothetical protein